MERREDFAITPVPEAARVSFVGNLSVFAGWTIWAGAPFFGIFMLQGLPIWPDAALAVLLGGLVLFAVVSLLGNIAAKKGVTTYLLSNYSLGYSGMRVVGVIMFVAISGWFAISTGFVGNMLAKSGGFSNWYIIPPLSFLYGIAAILGYRAVTFVGKITLPILVVGFPILLIIAWVVNPGAAPLSAKVPVLTAAVTFPYAVGLMINNWIMGCTSSPDITRYAKNNKHVVGLAALTLIPLYWIIQWMGAPYGILTGNPDVIGSLVPPSMLYGVGWAVVAVILALVSIWNTADVQCWIGSLSLSSVTKRPDLRWVFALGVCFIGALAGPVIWNYIFIWLDILGTVIPPLVGIWCIDYYVIRKRQYPDEPISRLANITAYISWAIGAGIGYWTGVKLHLGVAALNGMIITAFCYWVSESIKVKLGKA